MIIKQDKGHENNVFSRSLQRSVYTQSRLGQRDKLSDALTLLQRFLSLTSAWHCHYYCYKEADRADVLAERSCDSCFVYVTVFYHSLTR